MCWVHKGRNGQFRVWDCVVYTGHLVLQAVAQIRIPPDSSPRGSGPPEGPSSLQNTNICFGFFRIDPFLLTKGSIRDQGVTASMHCIGDPQLSVCWGGDRSSTLLVVKFRRVQWARLEKLGRCGKAFSPDFIFISVASGRSRVRFPLASLEFLIYIILPAALLPWGRPQSLTQMSTRNVFWGVKAAGAQG